MAGNSTLNKLILHRNKQNCANQERITPFESKVGGVPSYLLGDCGTAQAVFKW